MGWPTNNDRPLALQLSENIGPMRFGFDLRVYLFNLTFFVNQKGRAKDSFVFPTHELLGSPGPEGLDGGSFFIGQKRIGKLVLGGKVLLSFD